MTFERLHKGVVYALVIVGLLPLATSGEVSPPVLIVTFGAVVASWFYEAPRSRVQTQTRWWTLGTIGALLAMSAFGATTGNWLLAAIYFALVMVVTRMFQSRGSRDVFQLYGLSFLAVIAGAVVNPTLSFVAFFLAYVVLLTWGLTLLHLQRDLELLRAEQVAFGERPSDLAWRARDLVSPGFLAGSSALALVLFASSLAIFFFFPRLGMGFFFSQGRLGQQVSGFSDRIELGHFGTIKDNLRVVMRVELPEARGRRDASLRMRGISFDHYDGRVWSKSTPPTEEIPKEELGRWRMVHDAEEPLRVPGERLVQDVYLEPLEMDQRMVFGAPVVVAFEIDNARLDRLRRHPVRFYQDVATDVSTLGPTSVALQYRVISYQPHPAPDTVRAARGRTPQHLRRLYLQLPEGLDPRIARLAAEVAGDAPTAYDKALAVERHLLTGYAYSTEGGHDPSQPLSDFLFESRAGHCEFFASAMVVLLRTMGVPARPANGFYGGAYNAFGDYYALRQADAHSWVEVWLAGYGWMTFDPTPASEVLVPGAGGLIGTLDEWLDSLRLTWFKWVVEYDLEKQIAFFEQLGKMMGGLRDVLPRPEGSRTNANAWRKGLKTWLQRPLVWIVFSVPVLLAAAWRLGLLAALWRWLGRRRGHRRRVGGGAAGVAYRRMLRALRRQGLGRRSSETPRELAARLAAADYPAAAGVAMVTAAFETARYAEREPPSETLAALDGALGEVRRAARMARRPHLPGQEHETTPTTHRPGR